MNVLAGESVPGVLQHHRVSIETDQFSGRTDSRKDMKAVTAGADSSIHHHHSGLEIQPGQCLPEENWLMARDGRTTAVERKMTHDFTARQDAGVSPARVL